MIKKIKVFEAFAGYGGASFGLKKSGIPHEIIGYSENDRFASEIFELNHPGIKNYGDITKIKTDNIESEEQLNNSVKNLDLSSWFASS